MRDENLNHDRLMRLPPVLRGGFRPFFFAAACWALVVTALWVCSLAGRLELPTYMDSLAWHRHEMLFGFLGGAVAGFLLTAIPNWTGRLPVAGARLALLFALWLFARLALLFSTHTGAVAAVILDVGFPAALAFVAAREIFAAKNRNVPIVIILCLFALANGLDHAEALGFDVNAGMGWRAGFGLVLMLVSLIGGRIIPSFTRNWLAKEGATKGLPGQPGPFDVATLVVSGAALAGWVAAPDAKLVGALLVVAGGLHAIRLARWSGSKTMRDPLVIILHISYAWLPLGLLLLGASAFVWRIPASSALHALSAGAMSSMTLAVMTRATLGHTGHPLVADWATQLIYILVTLGAILRVAAPVLPFDYLRSIAVAGAMWGGAFLLFASIYGPKLLGPRHDGRP